MRTKLLSHLEVAESLTEVALIIPITYGVTFSTVCFIILLFCFIFFSAGYRGHRVRRRRERREAVEPPAPLRSYEHGAPLGGVFEQHLAASAHIGRIEFYAKIGRSRLYGHRFLHPTTASAELFEIYKTT